MLNITANNKLELTFCHLFNKLIINKIYPLIYDTINELYVVESIKYKLLRFIF